MAKELKFNQECRQAILNGVNKLANAVKITIGPKGANVMLEKTYEAPLITNDGVSIAKEIELEDPFENMGARVVREAATKTNDIAGDGTTTATVLTQAIINAGFKAIDNGTNPVLIRKGINQAAIDAVKIIEEMSTPIESNEDIKRVATISAGDEETGELIAEAMSKVGKDGIITIEESKSMETTLDVVEGMEIERGFASTYMALDTERMTTDLVNPLILVTDKAVHNLTDILLPLEIAVQAQKPVLLIADEISNEALSQMIVNLKNGIMTCIGVKAPSFGEQRKEILQDIAALTGGILISDTYGVTFNDMTLEYFGTCSSAKITKESTTLAVEGSNPQLEERISQIRNELEETTSEYVKESLENRLAKLSGGVAVIRVGAITETEMLERKLRIEDALNATKAAVKEGILPGGGSTYYKISKEIRSPFNSWRSSNDDCEVGYNILRDALSAPLKQICENAGVSFEVIKNQIDERSYLSNVGYDALEEEICDMIESGIVDPTKVTKNALLNAASIASTLLTTKVAVSIIKNGDTPTLSL